jgi:HD superfamily phosphohydrolase
LPTWGLSQEDRDRKPWGLAPEILGPGKVTTDPVHGDVHLTFLEQALADTEPFQRLRRVRQLGTTHLVYPGATHTRFSHSLGALRVVQDLLDDVLTQREGLHPVVPDLFSQWFSEDEDGAGDAVAEAVVLARLGALLHDLGHVPFGHSVEDDLGLLEKHDENETRFRRQWTVMERTVRARTKSEFGREVADTLDTLFRREGALFAELRPLIVSKGPGVVAIEDREYPFVSDLVGNTICADLLDYLLRDHMFTGLPASLGKRFTSAFFVVPKGRGPFSRRLALSIVRGGHERPDVVSELLKALRYRYELSERALVHHAKLVGDAMIGKLLELYEMALWLEEAQEAVAAVDNHGALLADRNLQPLREAVGQSDRRLAAAADRRVRNRLEELMGRHGDDGLLEVVAAADAAPSVLHTGAARVDELRRDAANLARAYLRRDLFAVAGRVGVEAASADALFNKFGQASKRVALQEGAQRFAELGGEPQVLIWLPDPDMRLKLAEVLVDDGLHINTFVDYERARGGRGSEIYDAHKRLWGLWVFVRRDVDERKQEEVLAYLAGELGVCWEWMRDRFGRHSATWVDRLLLSRDLGEEPNSVAVDHVLDDLPAAQLRSGGDPRTVSEYRRELRALGPVREARAARRA